jgi:hypothetical protein
LASRAPGIARHLGLCWSCGAVVRAADAFCPTCKKLADGRADAPTPAAAHIKPIFEPADETGFGTAVLSAESAEQDAPALQQVQEALADAAKNRPPSSRAQRTGDLVMIGMNCVLALLVIILSAVLMGQPRGVQDDRPTAPQPPGTAEPSHGPPQVAAPVTPPPNEPAAAPGPLQPPGDAQSRPIPDPADDLAEKSLFDMTEAERAVLRRRKVARRLGEVRQVEASAPAVALERLTTLLAEHGDAGLYPEGYDVQRHMAQLRDRIAAATPPTAMPSSPPTDTRPADQRDPALVEKADRLYAEALADEKATRLSQAHRKLKEIEAMDPAYHPQALKADIERVWKKILAVHGPGG